MLARGRTCLYNVYLGMICNFSVGHGFILRKRAIQREVEFQMKKTMMRKNLQKKFDLTSEISLYESDECPIKTKDMKVTSASSKIRNKTVANLIRNELQSLIDSGEMGEEMQLLNLNFTKATLSSYNRCQIFWEPFLSTKDLEVADMLNKGASKFRHLLMTNLILNNVPELQFYMDAQSYRIAVVDEILKNETLDVGDQPDAVLTVSTDTQSGVVLDQVCGLGRTGLHKRLAAARNKASPVKK